MKIRLIKLSELRNEDRFLLSYPLKPDVYGKLQTRLINYPLIIINTKKEVVFGIDLLHYIKQKSQLNQEVRVMEMELDYPEALLLNFNLKEKFVGTNLYEKIIFIKKIKQFFPVSEIYNRSGIDIKLDEELLKNLAIISGKDFLQVLSSERIILKTALKLCRFDPADRKFILDIFLKFQFSSSNQQKIMEMIEELMFREKSDIRAVFVGSGLSIPWEEKIDAKKIIHKLFKFRYPAYSDSLQAWGEQLDKIRLSDNVKISHSPFFEKDQVELRAVLSNTREMDDILTLLRKYFNNG